jgi:hypothetical protein
MIYIYQDDLCDRGLFAYFWTVVDVLKRLKEDDVLFVDLRERGPFYDPKYEPTNNVWEYYFQQPFNLTLDTYNQEHTVVKYDGYELAKDFIFGLSENHYTLSYEPNSRSIAKQLVEKHIRFQPHIMKIVNDFALNNFQNKKILGLHVRAGNMFIQGHAHGFTQFMTAEHFYPYVDKELDQYDNLFLITNTLRIRDSFISRYGNRLVYFDTDTLAPCDLDVTWLHQDKNYAKGEAAVVECVLLSLCNKMLVTGSNLGCLSTLLSNNEYEFIDQEVIYNY